jgi:preprotein translocase subunit SecD
VKDLRAYFMLAALALASCSHAPERRLERGVYEVISVVEEPGALPLAGPGERWFPYAPSAVDDGPRRHFLLREDGAVPLELAQDPVCSEDEQGRKQIALTLTPEAGSALADLTRRLVGGQVAVVIGGEVISSHKVRQPILGNAVVISC